MTGANGEIAVQPWRIFPLPTKDIDNPTKQTGAWVTYQAGEPKYMRTLNFHLAKRQPYITPSTRLTLSKPKKIKNENENKY